METNYKPGILDKIGTYAMRTFGAGLIALAACAPQSKDSYEAPKPYKNKKPSAARMVAQADIPSPLESTIEHAAEEIAFLPEPAKEISYTPVETPVPVPQEKTLEEKYGGKKSSEPRMQLSDDAGANVKFLLNGKYTMEDGENASASGFSGTGKLIVDFGKPSIEAYVQGFDNHQEFKTTEVDGNGHRVWLMGSLTEPLGENLKGYASIGGGFETREYDVRSKTGSETFTFGNDSPFFTAKLGLTEKKHDDDDFGVGNRHSWILAQYTQHQGEATGDVEKNGFGDDYDAKRFKTQARYMIPGTQWSLEGNIALLDERIAKFLDEQSLSLAAGFRYHFEHPGYAELLGTYNKSKGSVAGDLFKERGYGLQGGLGWRVLNTDKVALDLVVNGGVMQVEDLIDRTDALNKFVTVGFNLFGSTKSHK